MILNLSLAIVFGCFFFVVICSILKKIELCPSMKGVLCVGMLLIISLLSRELHAYSNAMTSLLSLVVAGLVLRHTLIAYRRGFL